MIKVVHVSTFDIGGAAKAALNIHLGMLKYHVESSFICLGKHGPDLPNVYKYNPTRDRNIFLRLFRRLKLLPKGRERLDKRLKKINANVEYFSSPITSFRIHEHPLIISADLIHLHWVADFLDYSTFFKKINKAVVWTLHDFNPVLGGFHLYIDKKNNSNLQLRKLDHKYFSIKKKVVEAFSEKLTFVSPSKWQAENLDRSPYNKEIICSTINHIIKGDVFLVTNRQEARIKLGIDVVEIIFLSICTSVERKAKGIYQLIEALDELSNTCKFTLIIVGADSEVNRPYIRSVKFLEDDHLLSLYYSAANLFISPSFEESFSLTCAQALMCGIPVLSTPTGVMNNIIKQGTNGYLTNDFTPESIFKAIMKFFESAAEFDKVKVRNSISDCFTEDVIVNKYLQVYRDTLK